MVPEFRENFLQLPSDRSFEIEWGMTDTMN